MIDWSSKLNTVCITPSSNIDIIKGRLKKEEPAHAIKTLLEDPYQMAGAMGYKERKYSLDFNVLRHIPARLGPIAAILQTRCHQVSSFAYPFRSTKSLGYQIKHKNPHKLTTKGEREMILDLENYIQYCGYRNPGEINIRDNFKTLLNKLVRDSLTLDAAVMEIVPTHSGTPHSFLAVDGATVRLASADFDVANSNIWNASPNVKNSNVRQPAYVQIIDGKIENVYSKDELVYGIRNHRTDINIGGYGYSELEMLVNTITAHLNAEEHNRRFFSQGSNIKGILNFKGDAMGTEQMEGFRRLWRDQMEGVNNTWKTPVLQSEMGVEWIDLSKPNRDMEFSQWLEYLIKVGAAVFQIDPSEMGFDMQGGVSQTPLFESSQEWKLKASRDKGLRPLLTFFEDLINTNIIQRLDDDFVFQFVGLDELTEEQKTEQRIKQLGAWLTVNEVRRAEDLPELEDGDIILNPTYTQWKQVLQQQEQEKQQAATQQQPQMDQNGQPMQQGPNQQPQQEESNTEEHVPQYNS